VSLPASLTLDQYPGVTLEAPASAKATSSLSRLSFTGNLTIKAPFHTITLGQAQLSVGTTEGKVSSISGTAQVTFPQLDTFTGLGVASPVSASFGYDNGSALSNLGVPLQPNRKYIYVTFNAGFSASFGTGSVSSNAGVSDTLVFDPSDPSIYIAGPMAPLTAIGLSEQGLIPFQPTTTWGLDAEDIKTFNGQSFWAGEVSLEEIPVVVTGDVTTNYSGWNGKSALDKKAFTHTVGVNGAFNIGWDFLDGAFNFSLPVAKGSLYVQSTVYPFSSTVWASGTAGTATFLPSWIPALLSANSSVSGYFETAHPENTHFEGASDITVQASILGSAIGVPMNNLTLAGASFHVDKTGFRISGTAGMGLTPQLVSSTATITACFGGNSAACLSNDTTVPAVIGSKDWLVRMEGDTSLFGVPLISATATANPRGLTMESHLKTQIAQYEMTGTITASDAHVTGSASVSIPLTEANEVLGAVTDGAVCGYHEITDAAKCGFDTLDFGDEFHCGKPHCSWSWRHGLRCSLSCRVNVPRTCKDLSHPKTCTPSNVPTFNLGNVKGAVAMTINKSGIAGKFSGSYCASGSSSCVSLSEVGQVDFSKLSHPKLCLSSSEISSSLPAGKFCVNF